MRGDGESGSIRVSVEKIDSLINLVGELVITQAMLGQLGEQLDPSRHERLQHALAQLEHNTRDLQESVMSIRMLPINFIFSRFPRLVRDTATRLGKQVELHLHGEHTELDKSVIEKLSDPLTHIVRNSIDHGIETPAERLAAGKPASGTVKLAASHQGGSVVVEVSDDGRGLSRPRILAKARERNLPVHDGMSDAEVWQLVFMPGFSTAETVTELSGRGVGMDVVKRNIGAMGGRIDIDSAPGMGTRIGIRLPLTLAILDGLIVAVEAVNYVIPLTYIVESLQARSDDVRGLGGEDNAMIRVRGEYLPLFSLHELLRIGGEAPAPEQGIVVILESEGRSFALQVDELVGQQQVVIKSLEQNFRRVEGIAGATIMGDGSVALILDVDALPRLAARRTPPMNGTEASQANGPAQEYLTFTLGREEYAIDILRVQEIRGYDQVTAIANAPPFIKGVINLRGAIVPIVDLRIKFHLAEVTYDPFTVVIILNIGRRIVGVVVDSVSDVIALGGDAIRPPPEFGASFDTEYLLGLATAGERMLILVDIERLMTSREMALVDEAA